MFSRLLSLFTTAGRKAPGHATPRRPSPSPLRVEELESRLVPSSVPLHVSGTRVVDPDDNAVVLRGVNVTGLESAPDGLRGDPDQVLGAVDVALNDWHANLIRLTVYPDYWSGAAGNDATTYRRLVDRIVARASSDNAYVMLAVWGSDMGDPTIHQDLHDLPDQGTNDFWADAARHKMLVDGQGNPVANGPSYANNPAVMFDPFNEPHDNSGQVGWSEWRNGGSVTETSKEGKRLTYNSPGMQGLVNTIRAAGANNVVAVEGLGYGSDLSGVGAGLIDPANNQMYSLHLYPAQWQSAADGDTRAQPVAGTFPVYVGEFGTPSGPADPAAEVNGVPQQGATQWTKDMLSWLHQRGYSWSAWSLSPETAPVLVQDYGYTPTPYFGQVVKDDLANSAAADSLLQGLKYALSEQSWAVATDNPNLGLAQASFQNSYLAYTYAQSALNTQSAADWAAAQLYALDAQAFALADAASIDPVFFNPYAGIASAYDASGYNLAATTPFYGSV